MQELSADKYEYTLCFMFRNSHVLMLERQKEPNKGLWNGVGGHIELGESPNYACLREIREETGLSVDGIRFCGILSWESWYFPSGGMYIYSVEAPEGDVVSSDEGQLAWKDIDWVMQSSQVVSNISKFLPDVIQQRNPVRYHCYFNKKQLFFCERVSLPEWATERWLKYSRFQKNQNVV
ncbi:MAG: 8-oxo-dGTP diphosphatase [Anaerolineaceae bacterium]|nr:8-oxo-dGTP diphosphatase [Anaerolineaceae bacterium]